MKATPSKRVLIPVLVAHILLFFLLFFATLNAFIDTLVPENLASYHYAIRYEQIKTVKDAELSMSFATYRHNKTGSLISKDEHRALSPEEVSEYTFDSGWRYLCTANGVDYCIYSQSNGDTVKAVIAMRLSDKFLPWQVGTAFAAGALLIVALLYFLGLALLLKKLLAPKEPQSPAQGSQ